MSDTPTTPPTSKKKTVSDCGAYKHLKWETITDETSDGKHPRRKDSLTIRVVPLSKGKLIETIQCTYAHYSAERTTVLSYELKIANIMKSWSLCASANETKLKKLENEGEILGYLKEHGQIKEKSIANVKKKPTEEPVT